MFSICSFTRDDLSAWTIMLCYSHCLFAAWTNVQKFPNTPDEIDYSEIIFLGGSIIPAKNFLPDIVLFMNCADSN